MSPSLPTVPCPSCGAALPPAADRCRACGVSLAGPAAEELWQVDQQLAVLRQRRIVLLAALQSTPQPAVPGPTMPPPAAAPAGRNPRRGWPAQQVLLAVGALLVVVAATVFLAVAWDVLGVGGQVAVMAGVTLVAGGISFLLASRGLRASAEALASVSIALALVDAAAAYWLDLSGLSTFDELGYAAWVAAGLALVLVAVSPPVIDHAARTYRIVALLAATVAPLLGLVAVEPMGLTTITVCALVATLAGLGSRRLARGWAHYRRPLTAIFGGYLVLTWLLAPLMAVGPPLLGEGGLIYAVGLVLAIGAGWAAGLHHGWRRAAAAHPVLAVTTLLGGALQVVAPAAQSGLAWVALLAVVAALVPALAAGTAADFATTRLGLTAIFAQLVSVGAVLATAVLALDTTVDAGWAPLTVALAGACCSAVFVAARRPRWHLWSGGWAAATGAGAIAAATAPLGLPGHAYAVAGAAAALAVVAAVLRTRLELVVGNVIAATALGAIGLAASADPGPSGLPPLALVLAGLGLVALAYGIRPHRGRVAWVGVSLCSAGNAVRMAALDVTVVEAYSLPLAGLALVVGLVRLYRKPSSPSWLTVGPAVSAGLLPSAFATVGDPSLIRPVVVLGVALAVMVAGIAWRWQAPFLTGATAACVVAVAQLAPYAVGAPRWLSFGSVGVVLLVLGFRYEQRRRNATQAARWVFALH